LPSRPPPTDERASLAAQLHEICERLFAADAKIPLGLEEQLERVDDPSILVDVLGHACLEDSEARQSVFEELDVSRRVALLSKYLTR
jgi:hypothetical protein